MSDGKSEMNLLWLVVAGREVEVFPHLESVARVCVCGGGR